MDEMKETEIKSKSEEILKKCKYCPAIFRSRIDRKNHEKACMIMNFNDENPSKSPNSNPDTKNDKKCSKNTKIDEMKGTEIKHKSDGNPKKCKYCHDILYTPNERKIHEKTCNENDKSLLKIPSSITISKTYQCKYCNQKHYSVKELEIHEKICRKTAVTKCRYCHGEFHFVFSRKNHEKTCLENVKGLSKIHCRYCNLTFNSDEELKTHVKKCIKGATETDENVQPENQLEKTNDTPSKCQYCNLNYTAKGLKRHESQCLFNIADLGENLDHQNEDTEETLTPQNKPKLILKPNWNYSEKIQVNSDKIMKEKRNLKRKNESEIEDNQQREIKPKSAKIPFSGPPINTNSVHEKGNSVHEKEKYSAIIQVNSDKIMKEKRNLKRKNESEIDDNQQREINPKSAKIPRSGPTINTNSVHEKGNSVHEKEKSKEKPFNCEICDVQFLHESDVTLHLQLVHNSSKPKEQVKVPGLEPTINKSKKDCQNCDQKFSSDFQLKIHNKLSNGKPMKCNKCKFKACTARGFDIHEKKCKGMTENTSNNSIQKHPENTDIPKKCKQKQCRHTFNSVEELEIHEKHCLRNRIVEFFSNPNEPKKANIPCAEPTMIPNGLQIIKNKELEKSMTSNEKVNGSVSRNKEFIESLARKRNNCPDCDQDFHRHKDLQQHINTTGQLISECLFCCFQISHKNQRNFC